MNRLTALAPAFALVVLLAACGRSPGLDRLASGETGRVAEIRSGDSLVLDNGLAVRLAGVEAPKDDAPYAAQARDALRKLVDGRTVRLLYGGARRDRYQRALAQVKLAKGGAWVEEALLRAGAVRARTWADNRAMAGEMLEAEAWARNRKKGLWALPAYKVLTHWETTNAFGFQIVEGRVRRTGQTADGSSLDFADLPGPGFTAEIPTDALASFKTAGKAPEQLRGRLLRVRGPLRAGYGGPVMRLDHPEQVEFLKEKD